MLVGAALGGIVYGADYLGLPAVKKQVQPYLTEKYMPLYLIAIGLVTEAARRRTLPK